MDRRTGRNIPARGINQGRINRQRAKSCQERQDFGGISFGGLGALAVGSRLLGLAGGARVPVAAEAVEATLLQELAQVVARDIGLPRRS